jgi:DNA polymerase II small subunit
MDDVEKIRKNLKKGFLTHPELLGEEYLEISVVETDSKSPLVVFKDTTKATVSEQENDWFALERARAMQDLGKAEPATSLPAKSATARPQETIQMSDTAVQITYTEQKKKKTIQDFIEYYMSRYRQLSSILRQREELKSAISIKRAKTRANNETITIIGMVRDKRTTKNDNLLLVVEDQTDTISVVISKNRATRQENEEKSLFEEAQEICLDEVIGIVGNKGETDVLFVTNIVWPDTPIGYEYKKAPVEEYAVFIGDTHFGSKHFLDKEFSMFLSWITGKMGSEQQKEISEKIKYLFIVGDLVEGIGIYPRQEEDLAVKDIFMQYGLFSKFLKQIPANIKIFICPGNHDAIRLHEPQPPIYEDFASELYNMSNITFLSSPSLVTIARSKGFSGLDVLLYHGFSFPFYADAIESIRQKGGLERTDLILKFLLKRRHFAPQHGSNQFVPDYDKDPLVISSIPDIIATGHIHRATVSKHKGITMLNCSCWIGQTEYQEKRGIKPQPAKALVMNLHTREVKVLNFMK